MHLNLFLDECIVKLISRLMMFLKKISLVASVFLVAQLAQSQETIPVSGGAVHRIGGLGSYTVGYVFYSTNTSTTVAASEGVQQFFEFQTLSNPELTTVNLTAIRYPNLTKDFITLKITDTAIHPVPCTLFDVNGKAIVSNVIVPSSDHVQMKLLYTSAYV
jgi:hypothetical protein